MFHHLAHFLSQFPISPSRIRQMVEQHKSKSTQPRYPTRWTTLYSTRFELNASSSEASSIMLDCKGLDTAASIYLNGNLLGSTDNMFVRYKFEMPKSLLAADGNNSLEIAFESPVTHAEKAYELQASDHYSVLPECVPPEFKGECHANHIRKMQASAWTNQHYWRFES